MQIKTIHNNLCNGQRRKMVKQIQEYGLYDFWNDYIQYLNNIYPNCVAVLSYFSDAVISYHRITSK